MKKCDFLLFLFLLLFLAAPASAQKEGRLLEIPPGITTADVTGDGYPETILNMWAERIQTSYRGNHVIMFLSTGEETLEAVVPLQDFVWPADIADMEYWQDGYQGTNIIGIEDGEDGRLMNQIFTDPHDICMQEDYRLLYKGGQAYLIGGNIESEFTRCAEGVVTFRVYKTVHAGDNEVAVPDRYFKFLKTWHTEKVYGNITESFQDNERRLIEMAE